MFYHDPIFVSPDPVQKQRILKVGQSFLLLLIQVIRSDDPAPTGWMPGLSNLLLSVFLSRTASGAYIMESSDHREATRLLLNWWQVMCAGSHVALWEGGWLQGRQAFTFYLELSDLPRSVIWWLTLTWGNSHSWLLWICPLCLSLFLVLWHSPDPDVTLFVVVP